MENFLKEHLDELLNGWKLDEALAKANGGADANGIDMFLVGGRTAQVKTDNKAANPYYEDFVNGTGGGTHRVYVEKPTGAADLQIIMVGTIGVSFIAERPKLLRWWEDARENGPYKYVPATDNRGEGLAVPFASFAAVPFVVMAVSEKLQEGYLRFIGISMNG